METNTAAPFSKGLALLMLLSGLFKVGRSSDVKVIPVITGRKLLLS